MSLISSIFGSTSQAKSDIFAEKVEVPALKPLPPTKISEPEKDEDESGKQARKRKRGIQRKEGEEGQFRIDQSNDADRRTVFVGNLPLDFNRKKLAKLFQSCGRIESTRIRSVAVAGVKLPPEHAGNQNMVKKVCSNTQLIDTNAKSSVVGYVVFGDEGSVAEALKLNNTKLDGDRRLRVDHASAQYDAQRSIFIGNLPYGADESTLQEHFCQGCGLEIDDVVGVRIVRDRETFQCKGFGYVLFRESSMVSTALQRMDGKVYGKRELRVQVCGKRFKSKIGKKGAKKSHDEATPSPSKKQRTKEVRKVSDDQASPSGVLRRILEKSIKKAPEKKRRVRGEKSKKNSSRKPGVSKRATLEAKVDKRVKKLEKRASKGMGKAKR